MKKIRMKRLSAVLLGTSMFLPLAQADDIVQIERNYTRPLQSGPVTAPDHLISGEVEVFIRLSEKSVAELNIDSIKNSGKMASSDAQKNQAKKVARQQEKMRLKLAKFGITEMSSLRVGANGLRVKVDVGNVEVISGLSGVRSVAPVTVHTLDNSQSVPWIGTKDFWSTIGKGEGVSIGIIDTGIDYKHKNFGGRSRSTFPTNRVVGGYDFVGDDYDNDGSPIPNPDDDPLDCHGHGSHVAGSAAGKGVKGTIGAGVAKKADLYALKVFGCSGSTTVTSDAIEWAMDPNGDGDMSDHLDVINMSLGSPFGSPDDPSAITTNNAADVGIIVATSAGNEGNVPYITGAPGVASKAISTAASTKGGTVPGIHLSGDVNDDVEGLEGTSPARVADGAVSGALQQQDDNIIGCSAFTDDFTGSIALISRGACGFHDKFLNAQNAGAVAVVVYNDGADPGRIDPIVMGGIVDPVNIPGIMVSYTDGAALSTALGSGDSINAVMDDDIETELFDRIAGFSSRGPGHGGSTFKPDISAPGASIFSTLVGSGTEGITLGGTSMASPHTAGVAALLRQQHPDLDSAAIKSIIQNSAADMQEFLPLARQGTGRLDVSNAMKLSSYTMPAGVSFGHLNPDSKTTVRQTVMVTDFSGMYRRTFTATHVPNQTMPGVSVSCPDSVTVPYFGSIPYQIKIKLNPAKMPFDLPFFTQAEVDGWCVLTDGKDTLKIGYMAVVDPASLLEIDSIPGGVSVDNSDGQTLGIVDTYTLAAQGGEELDRTYNAIEAVGFRYAEIIGYPVIELGVASEKPWESPSNLEWDFLIDNDKDGFFDAVLVAVDISAFGGDPGTMVTAQFNLAGPGAFLDWNVNIMDYNDSVGSLPFTLFPFGFASSSFDYQLELYGRDGSVDVQNGSIDLADEILIGAPALLGVGPGETIDLPTAGTGEMLFFYPSNYYRNQVEVVRKR